MKNLYTPSTLLTKSEFLKIERALQRSWSEKTAVFARDEDEWSEQNPAKGQCLPTAALINDLFGGKLVYDKANSHYWNELSDGTWQDFTRVQFADEVRFKVKKLKAKSEALNDSHAIKHGSKRRYELLKQKFLKNYDLP